MQPVAQSLPEQSPADAKMCACVLLLAMAGHIITWCELNDHTPREHVCIRTANFGLVEHGCGARMKTVGINIKAARVATAHKQWWMGDLGQGDVLPQLSPVHSVAQPSPEQYSADAKMCVCVVLLLVVGHIIT